MRPVLSLEESAGEAAKILHIFDDGKPDLIPTGVGPVDRLVGGLFPGAAGILAAATGVGKSSLILAAALSNRYPVGVVSTEDTPDVWGSRALAWASGVNSLRIRTKSFTDKERGALLAGRTKLSTVKNVRVAYEIGSTIDEVCDAIKGLADAGCRMVWVDYLQKIRGISDDRRNEVSIAYTAIQRVCDRNNVSAMVVSQFSRQPDPSREPQIWWLKESGDLENEARIIILGKRDSQNQNLLHFRLAKSTVGGDGLRFQYLRDGSGTLREVVTDSSEEAF